MKSPRAPPVWWLPPSCLSYLLPATTSMTFLPLARTILAAAAPLLNGPDSTTVVRPVAPAASAPAVVAMTPPPADADSMTIVPFATFSLPTPIAAVASAVVAAVAPAAVAPAPVRIAAPAAVVAGPTGLVPMPAWATGARLGLVRAARADSIVVEKGQRRMTLFSAGSIVGTYLVALGKSSAGAKERAGDYKTPEGLYHIDARNPNSRYHLALHVSYPNADDMARARKLGVSTGGDIMIHGLPNGQGSVGAQHRAYDWTNGCVAVTDQEIEQIWSAVPVGTPIRIVP